MAYHVDERTFADLVERALGLLPEQFAAAVRDGVPVQIRDRPTAEQLESVGLTEDHLLLGLYVGRPMTERSVLDQPLGPDVIYVFQDDVELASDSRDDLVEQVRVTVLHEVGHHFGLDEDELERLGYG